MTYSASTRGPAAGKSIRAVSAKALNMGVPFIEEGRKICWQRTSAEGWCRGVAVTISYCYSFLFSWSFFRSQGKEEKRKSMKKKKKKKTPRLPLALAYYNSHHAVLRPALQKRDNVIDRAAVQNVRSLRGLVGVVRREHD